jgi:tetratricopeptide (TPR) repeat protein
LDFSNPSSLLNATKNLMHQKKYNKALNYITLFLKCYPNSFEGFFLKCQIYTKLYRGNKALVLLNKVLVLLDKENDIDHLMEIKILNYRGKCLIFLNRYEEAIETYKKINQLKLDARNFLKIGVCYYNKKNIDEAINNYDKAIELNPNFTEAYFNKGICLSNQQKKEEAIEVFNKAIEIANNDAELYLNRGYCYFSLKNFRKAIKDFNKAIELRPNFSEAYCRKAACYQEMKKVEEALLEYKHAIEINDLHSKPILFQAALYVSTYYRNKKNYEEALP